MIEKGRQKRFTANKNGGRAPLYYSRNVDIPAKKFPERTSSKKGADMKVLFITSEAGPFVKTGGLGDVSGSLPVALSKDCEIRVVLPLYEAIGQNWREKMRFIGNINIQLAWRNQYCGVFELEYQGVIWYFIDNEYYFKRRDIYGAYDDGERFAYFSKAAIDILGLVGFMPDVIHANDWQSALVPTYLKTLYGGHSIKTVFTIHNIEYQGKFSAAILGDVFGISKEHLGAFLMEDGGINLMQAAICYADAVTTVSPTYACEIQGPSHGYGLDGLCSRLSYKLQGIINGIDTETFNPKTDPYLLRNYGPADVEEGKRENKQALLKLLGLTDASEDTPVIGIISRLVPPKGMDLICNSLHEIMKEDVRLVVLGTGEWSYEQMLLNASRQYAGKLSANIRFSGDLASKIYAGADMLLMPSQSEPCGLSQLIAMQYGTIPLVRETGGLKDTVVPYNQYTGEGNGFSFTNYNEHDMIYVLRDMIGVYRDKPVWKKLIEQAMAGDRSWKRSAENYLSLYAGLSAK